MLFMLRKWRYKTRSATPLIELLDGVRNLLVESEHFFVEVQGALPVKGDAGLPVENVGNAIEVGL